MIKAILETRNFVFESYAENEIKAETGLLNGLKRHCEQYGLIYSSVLKEYKEEIEFKEIKLDICYRDGNPL